MQCRPLPGELQPRSQGSLHVFLLPSSNRYVSGNFGGLQELELTGALLRPSTDVVLPSNIVPRAFLLKAGWAPISPSREKRGWLPSCRMAELNSGINFDKCTAKVWRLNQSFELNWAFG